MPYYDYKASVTVPLVVKETLREVGRHIEDRNDLGVTDQPQALGLLCLLEEYIQRHSEDFEQEAETQLWQYRGQTDAPPLEYDSLEAFAAEDDDDQDDDDLDGDDTEQDSEDGDGDDRRLRMTLSLDD